MVHINRKIRFFESEEDKLDYLAGIVDTEGTIDYHSGSSRLTITNTDIRIHKWLKKEFGGRYYPSKKIKKEKQIWKWLVSGKDAYKILKRLEDKLILKNEQLVLCIEMYERITKWNFSGRKPKPQWAKDLTKEIDAKLHILNKRGVDKTGVLRPDSEIKIGNKLVYLAGYIDGDGTIGIGKDYAGKPPKYNHHIAIPSTDRRGLEWIKKNWSGTVGPREPKKEKHAETYGWKLTGKNAYKLLKIIRDHLILKQEQADCVIKMYEKVVKWNIKRRPTWAVKLQEEMFQKCKELNKRGGGEGEITLEEEDPELDSQATFNHWK